MINIKVEHKDIVRKFSFPPNASWIELEGKLRTLFDIPKLAPFTLSYTDEDNDVITLSTDIELHEIFSSNNQTIKFNLKFSASDDLSDSDDNDTWVLEGGPSKSATYVTTIETDNSGLQNNVSQKNIISTTNQEPQYIENETLDKKTLTDDDFERVENSPNDVERVEKSPNDVEVEKSPNDVEVEKSPNDVEVEKSPNDVEVEKSPNDVEIEKSPNDVEVENSPNDVEKLEKSPNDVERVEKSPSGLFVERSSNDLFLERASNDLFLERASNDSDKVVEDADRVENLSNKKISRVNLLDDEFFESFNSFKISSNIAPFEPIPQPIPIPQPQREVEDEQEDEKTIGTLSSSNFSPFSERSQPQRQQDQNNDIEELKEIIEQFAKKDPQLTASIIDEIRPSIHVDNERLDPFRRPTQSKEDKHNVYFRQYSPISGRSRSATPPRSGYNRPSTPEYNRSSTPPRSGYNRPSTPEYTTPPRSGYNRPSTPEYNRSSTPPRSGHNPEPNRPSTPEYIRSSTPPILPGSFPVPTSTPCLWIDNESPRPDSNTNQKNGKSRRGGRRGGYRYRNRRNQRNSEQSNAGEEILDREDTPDREETPEQKENNPYQEDIEHLNEMGFGKFKDRYVELLKFHKGDVNQVIDKLFELN